MNEEEKNTIKGIILLGIIYISINGWFIFLPLVLFGLFSYLVFDNFRNKLSKYISKIFKKQ